tara:strand:- start:541 stop:675 length:135 start_codon:yes stop_codon:yes gene_type:complete
MKKRKLNSTNPKYLPKDSNKETLPKRKDLISQTKNGVKVYAVFY